MKILVSGPRGLVGSRLIETLKADGHDVNGLSRTAKAPGDIAWDPAAGKLDGDLSTFDVVIHLAGESIAEGRWTAAKRQRIRDSRIKSTALLAERMAELAGAGKGPKHFLVASAIGIYGSRGNEELTEDSSVASGPFLVEVGRDWEAAADPARAAGLRVVHLRIGIVLSPEGGALGKMLPLFKLGGGGRLGPGTQYWSWISIDDTVGAIRHALNTESLSGPVNLTAPAPVTNSEFTRILATAVKRPALFPAPVFALKLALGADTAEQMLLASTRVLPRTLETSGYQFKHPDLASALRDLI